jgi:hypothetical protein
MKAALSEFSANELAKKEKQKQKAPIKKDIKKAIAKFKEIIESRPKNPLNKNKYKER